MNIATSVARVAKWCTTLALLSTAVIHCSSNDTSSSPEESHSAAGKPNQGTITGGSTSVDPPNPGLGVGGLNGAAGGGAIDNFPRGTAKLTGTVWGPGNAPGMVPDKHEIPVFDALVQLSFEAPPAIPQKTYCEVCTQVQGITTQSDHRGHFSLENAPAGTYSLSIRKGQFRIDRKVTITEGQTLELEPTLTTLPSTNDPAAGNWIPRMAVAVGAYDNIEDVIGKMGIGGLTNSDDGPAWNPDGPGADAVDIYQNGGRSYDKARGTFADLLQDRERLLQYHIIFVACSDWDVAEQLSDPQALKNVRDYVAEGGKLYVTDWSSFVADNVFPEELRFGPSSKYDSPATAYDRTADTWHPESFATMPRDDLYNSENAEAIDTDLAKWITGQTGPAASSFGLGDDEGGGGGKVEVFDGSKMLMVDSYQRIEETHEVTVGVDDKKNPVVDKPRVFVIGGEGDALPKRPLTVSFQPAGCGRVLYSTYHTSPTPHEGLFEQERILMYLIMEVTVCRSEPVAVPPVIK